MFEVVEVSVLASFVSRDRNEEANDEKDDDYDDEDDGVLEGTPHPTANRLPAFCRLHLVILLIEEISKGNHQ